MSRIGPSLGEFYVCKDFYLGADSMNTGIAQAKREIQSNPPAVADGDALYVVQIVAVVRRRTLTEVESIPQPVDP